MSGKVRERESAKKCVKGRYAAGRTGITQGQTEEWTRNTRGRMNVERAKQGTDRRRRAEEQNGTEAQRRKDTGIQQNGQGATKARKGAEFLKDLHLRAGFGIMER